MAISSRRESIGMAAALVLSALIAARPVTARTLEEALVSTFPGVLRSDGAGLAQVFARTVATSFPVTGTSSAYVYRFDAATDSFQRLTTPLGPVFSERAQIVGPHKLSLAVNYALLRYDTIDGRDLNSLVSNDPTTGRDYIAACSVDEQGRRTCEPVQGIARIDLEAQMMTVSATYGIAPDFDVNLSLPLVRSFLRASTVFTGPDPRVSTQPQDFFFTAHATETSTGIGDVLLRAKYVFTHAAPVDLAGGLTLSLPTGDRANFHGVGDTLVGTALYASHTYAERLEPHVNLSFVLDADKFDRSQVRYSVGADIRIQDWLSVNNDFLGRSDIAPPDTIARPVFLQIERADVLQFSTGIKVTPVSRTAVFVGVLLPLNDDGVRADQVLTLCVEGVF